MGPQWWGESEGQIFNGGVIIENRMRAIAKVTQPEETGRQMIAQPWKDSHRRTVFEQNN